MSKGTKKIKPCGKVIKPRESTVMINAGPRAQHLVWDVVCQSFRDWKTGKFVPHPDGIKKRNKRKDFAQRKIDQIDEKCAEEREVFVMAQFKKNKMTVDEAFKNYIYWFTRDFVSRSLTHLSRSFDNKYSVNKGVRDEC